MKELSLFETGIQKIVGLDHLNQLEALTLQQEKYIESLDLKGLKSLKNLSLRSSENMGQLLNLSDCVNIENINLYGTLNLEKLEFKNYKFLQNISLEHSLVKELDLSNLPQLKSLSLNSTKNLNNISLNILPLLKQIEFYDSNVDAITINSPMKELKMRIAGKNSIINKTNYKQKIMGVEYLSENNINFK